MATCDNCNSLINSKGPVEPKPIILDLATADHNQEFFFTHTGPLRISMKVFAKNDQNCPLYYISITGSFGDDTDLSLHAGSDRDQALLGTCHFNKFHASQIQVHRQNGPKLKMIMIKEHGYHWSMPWVYHSTKQGHTEMERHFYWRAQGRNTSASSGSGKLCLELCGTEYADVYAIYSGAAPGTRKGGILQLRNNLGEEWRTMVVLTLSALLEKARQTRARDGSFSVGMLLY